MNSTVNSWRKKLSQGKMIQHVWIVLNIWPTRNMSIPNITTRGTTGITMIGMTGIMMIAGVAMAMAMATVILTGIVHHGIFHGDIHIAAGV
jgi:hypothetical protein